MKRKTNKSILLNLLLLAILAFPFTLTNISFAAGSISITQPTPGAAIQPGTAIPITWTYTGDIGSTVAIAIVPVVPNITPPVGLNQPAGNGGSGSYTWTPPLLQYDMQYVIIVTSVQNKQITAKTVVTIPKGWTVAIKQPIEGTTVKYGEVVPIRWAYIGPGNHRARVRAYPLNGGGSSIDVQVPITQNGYDGWTTPSLTSDVQYIVKVEDIDSPKTQQAGLYLPSIGSTIKVTVPAAYATTILIHPSEARFAHSQKSWGVNYWEGLQTILHPIASVTNTSNYGLKLWFTNSNGDVSPQVDLGPHQSTTDFNYLKAPAQIWWGAAGPVYGSNSAIVISLRIDYNK